MKIFLKNTAIFGSLVAIIVLLVLVKTDMESSTYYQKFTTSSQPNLILGLSRAARGIRPTILKKKLNKEFYNYAFTFSENPYGKVYLKSLKKKLDKNQKGQIFILSVNLGTLVSGHKEKDDEKLFRENSGRIAETNNVNTIINFEFLKERYSGQYYKLFDFSEFFASGKKYIHENGWVETFEAMDTTSIQKRKRKNLNIVTENTLGEFRFSKIRLEYLKETIHFLDEFGKVYMVRLPICSEHWQIEQEGFPAFDSLMRGLPKKKAYINLTDHNSVFLYTDGSHLNKKSATKVTQMIADSIAAHH